MTGGASISSNWNDAKTSVEEVGGLKITFQDNHTGVLILGIKGVISQKTITRLVFSELSPGALQTALCGLLKNRVGESR